MAGANPPNVLVEPRNVPVPSSASTPDAEMHGPATYEQNLYYDARSLHLLQQNVEVSFAQEKLVRPPRLSDWKRSYDSESMKIRPGTSLRVKCKNSDKLLTQRMKGGLLHYPTGSACLLTVCEMS